MFVGEIVLCNRLPVLAKNAVHAAGQMLQSLEVMVAFHVGVALHRSSLPCSPDGRSIHCVFASTSFFWGHLGDLYHVSSTKPRQSTLVLAGCISMLFFAIFVVWFYLCLSNHLCIRCKIEPSSAVMALTPVCRQAGLPGSDVGLRAFIDSSIY